MRIDLHTHSSASDGTDTPAQLMREAAAAGLDVVALTDHDAMSGWAEAQQAADEVGITLVPGLEMSTKLPRTAASTCSATSPTRRTRPSSPSSTGSSTAARRGRRRSSPRCATPASTSPRTTYAASPAAPSPPAARTWPTRWSGSGVVS